MAEDRLGVGPVGRTAIADAAKILKDVLPAVGRCRISKCKNGHLIVFTGHPSSGQFPNFTRVILDVAPGVFDVYTAADYTIPGIQACRSSINGGQPFEAPDLRDPEKRAAYREDHFAQTRFDHRNDLCSEEQDPAFREHFPITMWDLIGTSTAYRAYRDREKLATDVTEPAIRFSFTRDFILMRNQWIPSRLGVYRIMLNRACSFHCAGVQRFSAENGPILTRSIREVYCNLILSI